MEANSPLPSSSKNAVRLRAVPESTRPGQLAGNVNRVGGTPGGPGPLAGWHLRTPHPAMVRTLQMPAASSQFKKKTRGPGGRQDFVSCVILEGPFCLLNPETETWVKRKNPLEQRWCLAFWSLQQPWCPVPGII